MDTDKKKIIASVISHDQAPVELLFQQVTQHKEFINGSKGTD